MGCNMDEKDKFELVCKLEKAIAELEKEYCVRIEFRSTGVGACISLRKFFAPDYGDYEIVEDFKYLKKGY